MLVIGETAFRYENNVLSAQIFYKPKTVLTNKVYSLKNNKIQIDNSQTSKLIMPFAPGILLLGHYLKGIRNSKIDLSKRNFIVPFFITMQSTHIFNKVMLK